MTSHNHEVEATFRALIGKVDEVTDYLLFMSGGKYHIRAQTTFGMYRNIPDVDRSFQLWLNELAKLGLDREILARCSRFNISQGTRKYSFFAALLQDEFIGAIELHVSQAAAQLSKAYVPVSESLPSNT